MWDSGAQQTRLQQQTSQEAVPNLLPPVHPSRAAQVVCLQLDDPVQWRWHWPLSVDLRINGTPYRVYSRSSSVKLGTNQRDEAANIGVLYSACEQAGARQAGARLS